MLNQIILVGRLVKEVEIKELENDKKIANITLAIPRTFKNSDGEYDTDFVDIVIFDNVASNTSEYCHKGDIIGVKGRLQTRMIEKENKKEKLQEIIGEKITFLSSKGSDK